MDVIPPFSSVTLKKVFNIWRKWKMILAIVCMIKSCAVWLDLIDDLTKETNNLENFFLTGMVKKMMIEITAPIRLLAQTPRTLFADFTTGGSWKLRVTMIVIHLFDGSLILKAIGGQEVCMHNIQQTCFNSTCTREHLGNNDDRWVLTAANVSGKGLINYIEWKETKQVVCIFRSRARTMTNSRNRKWWMIWTRQIHIRQYSG